MNPAAILNVVQLILTLEPAAFSLVESLVKGVAGKSDAEILAGDASDWGAIVIEAHDAAQPPPSV